MTKQASALLVLFLAGCGGGTSTPSQAPSPTPSSATMQGGQWEFTATPSNSQPIFVEANLTVTGNGIGSTILNTSLFQTGGPIGGLFSDCTNFQTSGDIQNNTFAGMLFGGSIQEATFSGAMVASNGQSVSGGSYTASSSLCAFAPNSSTGTFTGTVIAPLNGTFAGTLTGTGADQITIQINQDANFGVTASGTTVQAGVTGNLSISPGSSNSNVIGATLQASGTDTDASGTSPFQVFGHFNAAATQITVVVTDQSGTETGTLTKQ